jgi:hypothetical protein
MMDCSIQLPIHMCEPYGADYDDDEMTFFPVFNERSIEECKFMSLNYHIANEGFLSRLSDVCDRRKMQYKGAHPEDTSWLTDRITIATSTCYSDRRNGLRITAAHTRHTTSRHNFIHCQSKARTVNEFMLEGKRAMKLGKS